VKGETPAPLGNRRPDQTTPNVSRREVTTRVHSAAVVATALDDGTWTVDVDVLDALGDLLAAASRGQLVAELEAA
jgi:hypothetical protein